MGDVPSIILNRFFDYPLKKKPCTFDTSPVSLSTSGDSSPTDFDTTTEMFYRKLAEKRKEIYENQNENDNLLKVFQDWNELTLSYLHSLFLMFCEEDNKMLSYKSFACILECLGDESLEEIRKERFSDTDKNEEGFIYYFDFLQALYNFHPPNKIDGLKRLCRKVAEKAILVNSLSLEKQLEYGLF